MFDHLREFEQLACEWDVNGRYSVYIFYFIS